MSKNKYLIRSPKDKLYYPTIDVFNTNCKLKYITKGDLYWEVEEFFKSRGVANMNIIRGQLKALLLRYNTDIVKDRFYYNKHMLKESLTPVMKNIESDYNIRASAIEVSNLECRRKMEIQPFGFNTKKLISVYDREKKIFYNKLVEY